MDLNSIYVKPESLEGEYAYDANTHRWVLDISEIKPMFPEARSDEELTRKCASYSRLIYNYLWDKVVATYNRPFVEWLISCTNEGKSIMLDCLKEQAEADAESGINQLRLSSPVDLSNGTTIKADLLENSVAPLVRETLQNAKVVCDGVPFYFNKAYNLGVSMRLPDDYEEYEY